MRFHAARHIHRLAPQVVDELLAADHARHYRPRIDSDAEGEPPAAERLLLHRVAHVERQPDQHLGVVAAPARHARRHHVAVADRLDLLEVVLLDQRVEALEDVVQEVGPG